jgi:enoyl-[acyl-carrier protein] reductase II
MRLSEGTDMLHTSLCELLGIEHPVIQAAMSLFTSAELVAAVSNAGGLGSLGAWRRPTEDLTRQLAMIRERTDRPFAVNFLVPDLDEAGFALTLQACPPIVSFALDDPGDLVRRVHDVGSLVMHQVTTVRQARQAVEHGVDVIIAQGVEAGGYVGRVATMALIPQVVDAVAPIPVIAAGGIADGRGLVASLSLGAAGVNLGTRFLASIEAPISPEWKQMIMDAASEDAVEVPVLNDIRPVPGARGYGSVARALSSSFTEHWTLHRNEARSDPTRMEEELNAARLAGQLHRLMAPVGQSAGLIRDIAPAGDIVHRLIDEAGQVMERLRTGSVK